MRSDNVRSLVLNRADPYESSFGYEIQISFGAFVYIIDHVKYNQMLLFQKIKAAENKIYSFSSTKLYTQQLEDRYSNRI